MLLMYCLVDQNQRDNVFLLTAKIKISWCLATTGGRNTPINAQGIEGLAIFSSNSLDSIEILSIQRSQGKKCAVGWLLAPGPKFLMNACDHQPGMRGDGRGKFNATALILSLSWHTQPTMEKALICSFKFIVLCCWVCLLLIISLPFQFPIDWSEVDFVDWLTDWLIDWLTGWLIDWLIARLIVWSFDWSFCLDI